MTNSLFRKFQIGLQPDRGLRSARAGWYVPGRMNLVPSPPGGCFDGPLHRYALRVYFEDTDLSGVVYHANYLRWFERARSDMVRLLGIDQRAAHEAGEGAFAVADLTIRYTAPARLADAVMIETLAIELRAASCRLHHRALRDGTLLAEAQVRVGFIAPDGRPRRQPAAWRAAFATVDGSGFVPAHSGQT